MLYGTPLENVTNNQVAYFLLFVAVAIFSYIVGGVREYKRGEATQELRAKLRKSKMEVEELREYIWLITAETTTPPRLMTAGGFPNPSVSVETSRHLNNVIDLEGRE